MILTFLQCPLNHYLRNNKNFSYFSPNSFRSSLLHNFKSLTEKLQLKMKNLFLFIYPAVLFRNSLKFTVIVAGLGSILAPARRHVPAIVTHGMYRPDPFLGRPSFNCNGATRLFTVPGGSAEVLNW